ncbi:uncharacterized protein J4E88_008941 [Alternaria novae-zelandiae]|uniref:uncharacterized protein n=1 Tax=Alternaria novae-zelandiae TaxID=430562 RepID=UPI0020C59F52|nr:uncharacterized protein J4E88_008941 [Alternaria novae-zelandiae]KAI4673328.1 hypothetical protein J4E88_008941 [Alternaria novae-zelandiae]
MTETSALKRAASEDPDVSSEPSNGVKKAKKVGTTDPTTSTAGLESIGATEPATAGTEPHNDVALQQEHAKAKDLDEKSGTKVQQPSKIAPAPVPTEGHDFSEDEKSVSPDGSDEDYDSEEDGDDEPYGHGLERDPDQGGLAMAPLSAEDELAVEIGLSKQDDEFDEYVKEHGEKVLYDDLASDSDDSEETADRKREELAELENEMDDF